MDYASIAPMMSQLWAPIAAVGTAWRDRANAQIAVAIGGASIVRSRPRVIVQLYKTNYTHELVLQSGAFALSFLHQDQLGLVRDLGFVSGRERDKLASIPHTAGATGSPILDGCFGYLDCRVVNAMDGGDMTCFLADVVDGDTRGGEALTWAHARTALPREWLEEWERKVEREVQVSLSRMGTIDRTPWTP